MLLFLDIMGLDTHDRHLPLDDPFFLALGVTLTPIIETLPSHRNLEKMVGILMKTCHTAGHE